MHARRRHAAIRSGTILAANQKALENGATVHRCLQFAQEVAAAFDIPFLFMSYFNIAYKFGIPGFVDSMATIGVKGAIVPDLPPEEGRAYLTEMERRALDPILIFSPSTSVERLQYLAVVLGNHATSGWRAMRRITGWQVLLTGGC